MQYNFLSLMTDIQIVFEFLEIIGKAVTNIYVQVFGRHDFSLRQYLGVGLLGEKVIIYVQFYNKLPLSFSKWLFHFTFPYEMSKIPSCSTSLSTHCWCPRQYQSFCFALCLPLWSIGNGTSLQMNEEFIYPLTVSCMQHVFYKMCKHIYICLIHMYKTTYVLYALYFH